MLIRNERAAIFKAAHTKAIAAAEEELDSYYASTFGADRIRCEMHSM
jgi:hypothetical protein